ncbi:hypothetical protein F5884DRAFT_830914 [Xylogone sp. PMI_703]|nr:hypothetical protein F5884DRAFT_830914 [Xylogone sp. PMI_703]
MRSHDMFNEESIERQQSLSYPDMSPARLAEGRERWKRIAICLFKVDISLSLLLDQPPIVRPEELQLSLPMTMATSDAHGLDEFCTRWAKEPADRELYSMSSLIGSYRHLSKSFLLIEDIAMGLAGALRCIWGHTQDRRQVASIDPPTSLLSQYLAQLNCWKVQLDRLSTLLEEPNDAQDSSRQFLINAYTRRDESGNVDENKSIIARITLLLFNANMLYHVLCLNLHADIRTINMVTTGMAKFGSKSSNSIPEDPLKLAMLRRWACSEDGRTSVVHAVSVLKSYEKALLACEELDKRLDPIAHIALSYSSAMVYAYITNSETCLHNVPVLLHIGSSAITLDLADNRGLQFWVENGGLAAMDDVSFIIPKSSDGRCLFRGYGLNYAVNTPKVHYMKQQPRLYLISIEGLSVI